MLSHLRRGEGQPPPAQGGGGADQTRRADPSPLHVPSPTPSCVKGPGSTETDVPRNSKWSVGRIERTAGDARSPQKIY